MTPQQMAALFATSAQLGEPFDADCFKPQDNGWIGAFVGLAYAECSPTGEVRLWCDCDEGVPYGSCVMCPTCGSHLESCKQCRCETCGRCEVACVNSGCPGY